MAKTPDGKPPKDPKDDTKVQRPSKQGKAESTEVTSPKESPEAVAKPSQELPKPTPAPKPPVKDSPKKPVRPRPTGLERKIDVGPLDSQP
jgi:hypothetical protein